MDSNPVVLAIDGKLGARAFDEAIEKLPASGGIVLDLSSVPRMTAGSIRSMERLAVAAQEKSAKVELRGVTIDVYKALKLVKLASKFTVKAG